MPDAAKISLGLLWEETIAFLRAEIALVLPLAMVGFGLPMVLMSVVVLLNVPPDAVTTGKLVIGPWIFWSAPLGLISMFGSLSVSALALHPGGSVREALGIAIARLPGGIGLALLNVAAQLSLTAVVEIVRIAEAATLGAAGVLSALANLAVFAATIWLFVRVMPVWALLSHRPLSPWQAVRSVFALTRGHYRKLLLLRVVAMLAGGTAFLVVLVPISALFVALGSLTGAADVAQALSFIAMGLVFALFASLWTIYVARLYAQLAGASNGI
jgi:hypothetical protein